MKRAVLSVVISSVFFFNPVGHTSAFSLIPKPKLPWYIILNNSVFEYFAIPH